VSWRHRIAIFVLAILTGLPVAGTMCALICESAATMTAMHHGSAQTCEMDARQPAPVSLRGVASHDCQTHDVVISQAADTTAAHRGDTTAAAAPAFTVVSLVTTNASAHVNALVHDLAAPNPDPPARSPLVLRI